MLVGSILQVFPFDFKPSAPPSGEFILYVRGTTIYLQDSTGFEYPFGSTTAINQLVGEATAIGPGIASVTLDNSAVIGKILTGFTPGPNSTVLATDTILQAIQKLQAQASATAGTTLAGDVTGGFGATVVSFVGGKSGAAVAQSVSDTQAATPSNSNSTIMKRDPSGNVAVHNITANSFIGQATGNEPPIVATSSADYYRGDKTFQPLNKAAVGLGNVDNTSDVNKPVSTAQAAADAAVQAYAIQRANHTGTQASSTISDFTEAAQDAVGAALLDTATVDFTYDDFGNQIKADVKFGDGTIDANGSGIKVATGGISNAQINAAAAIAYSKLNLTGSVTNADINAAAAIAYSKLNLLGSVTNADISATAAIVYSKLNLSNSITNADINAAAAIAYSKLNLALSITNADIAIAAAIAYSKLNLSASVTNSDIAAAAGIVYSKLTLTGAIVNADVSSSAAISYAKLALANSIVNGDISSSAAIAYSKLNLALSITDGDIAALAAIARTKLASGTANRLVINDPSGVMVDAAAITAARALISNANGIPTQSVTTAAELAFVNGVTSSIQAQLNAITAANTVDVTKVDTNSIAITLTGQQIKADLKLSADGPDTDNVKATSSIHADGLHVEIGYDTPVQVGTSNFKGSGSKFAAFDHVHAVTWGVIGGLVISTYTIGSNAVIAATDSLVAALGKLQGQISAIAAAAITGLTGDITASGPGNVPATIAVGAVTDTKGSLAAKPAVTVVSTTNIASLSGTTTIDGQALTAGTSIALLTAQTTASQNGPWVIQTGAWTRPTWYPSGGTTQAVQFSTTLVRLGTQYQGSTWRMTTAGFPVIDTGSTAWSVTPQAGNFRADYTLGLQTGAAAVTLAFANAFKAIISWNPTANFTLTMPPTAPVSGQFLSASDNAGTLAWSNPNTNIDGGRPDSVYTAAQIINGGTP